MKHVLVFVMIIILFRIVVADLYYVPTSSMEGEIFANSYVIVNKLSYGSKLPRSVREIPWVSYLVKKSGYNIPLWENMRLPGLEKIKRFDVVLGEYGRMKIIKRVLGLPGEQLSVLNGQCYINGNPIAEPKTVQLTQMVYSEDVALLKKLKADSPYTWKYQGDKTFQVTGSCHYFQQLPATPALKVKPLKREMHGTIAKHIFPEIMTGDWDQNTYGDIHIPKAGERIELNRGNWSTYCTTMEKYEGVQVDCQQIKPPFLINGQPADEYTFTNDYYFLMGDNRMNSVDSRFMGFIPVDLIFGRVDYPKNNKV